MRPTFFSTLDSHTPCGKEQPMRILVHLMVGLACMASLCGPCFAQPASTQPNTAAADSSKSLVPSDWQDLHERWQHAVEELKVPGLAVVVVKGDRLVLL